MKINLSTEEKFLQDLIFKTTLIEKTRFKVINYDKLVILSSSHLMLPTLYYNLKIKGYLGLIPKELKEYLSKIYMLNEERNKILLQEAIELSKVLKKNKIKFKFIKGVDYIFNNIHKVIGERMIGDIDFLINKNEISKIKHLLRENNYVSAFELKLWETKHLPRFTNPKKLFAIEPHSNVLRLKKNKYISTKKILNGDESDKFDNLLDICILNYQINDYGYLRKSYSYKTIYDMFMIIEKMGVEKLNINKNKYYKSFFITTNILGLTNFKIHLNIFDKFQTNRLKLKMYYKFFNKFDVLLCNIIQRRPKGIRQLIEFLINPHYRNYISKKLIR